MEFLSSWITNIILFILLAVILEMLLPQTNLQKYVKMVLGLLLIIIFLTPIFKLFSTDINEILQSIDGSLDDQNLSIENSIENNKTEIQADQRAYILEQTAVQLKEYTEEELINQFNYQFKNIDLQVTEDVLDPTQSMENVLSNLDKISVTLTESTQETQQVKVVQEVTVSLSEQAEYSTEEETEPIARYLSEQWGVQMNKIHITIERGNDGE